MQRFEFDWEYRLGRQNVADPLSRAPSLRSRPAEELHDNLALVALREIEPNADVYSQMVALTSEPGFLPLVAPVNSGGRHTPGVSTLTPASCYMITSVALAWQSRPSLRKGRATEFESMPIRVFASTRQGTEYSSEGIKIRQPKRVKFADQEVARSSQVTDEVHRHAPLVWDNASGSNDVLNETQESIQPTESSEKDASPDTDDSPSLDSCRDKEQSPK